jgi:glycosyltransferase involved in cell wall biosynthesis
VAEGAQSVGRVVVVLPSYNPTERVLSVVSDIARQGFTEIVVIDDGSPEEKRHIFDALRGMRGDFNVTVLEHEKNRGKGAALKTGFSFVLENLPDAAGVVTVDDDGQHAPEDIWACAAAMLATRTLALGQRDFSNAGVPVKSLLGNRITAFLYKVETGVDIRDTQTGLRALPIGYLPACLRLRGSGFEYETVMLLAARKEGFIITKVPIGTVYSDGNKHSRFRAFEDSAVIMFQFAKYSVSSLLAAGVDLLAFCLFMLLLVPYNAAAVFTDGVFVALNAVTVSTVAARVISASIKFIFNNHVVFGNRGSVVKAFFRYAALVVVMMTLSSLIVSLAAVSPVVNNLAALTAMKAVVDTALFVLNYQIQMRWVYNR